MKKRQLPTPEYHPLNMGEYGGLLFSKLVRAPAYMTSGYTIHGDYAREGDESHFLVSLRAFCYGGKEWKLHLSASDADDTVYTIDMPLNRDNWVKMKTLYDDIQIPEQFEGYELRNMGFR